MAAEYSCILKELLGNGWVRLRGGEEEGGKRRGGGVGRLIEGGGVGRSAGKNLQILDLHRLASLIYVQQWYHCTLLYFVFAQNNDKM